MTRSSRQLLLYVGVMEGGLLGIGLVWAYIWNIPWTRTFTPDIRSCIIGVGAGIVLLAINYLAVEYGSRWFAFFRTLKNLIEEDVAPLFQHLHLGVIAFIALFSGMVEEIFFRGVLLSHIGLCFSSLIFGLAHIWRKTAISYGMYVAVIGVYFGGIYVLTGNLWVPIVAHVVNNFVTILYYMRSPVLDSKQMIGSAKVSS